MHGPAVAPSTLLAGWRHRISRERRALAMTLALSLLGALALTQGGALTRPQLAWHDLQSRWLGAGAPASGVLVVDYDEASSRALRERFGGWPIDRALLALVTQYLLDAGARAVAVDIVLADPRDGDPALARVLADSQGRVVLAVGGLVAPGRGALTGLGPRPRAAATGGPPGCPVHDWPDVLLPHAGLAAPVGVVSAPVDADGQLRALPVWNRSADADWPSLSLAVLLAARGQGAAGLRCSDGYLRLDERAWPIDAQGRIAPRYAARPEAIPALALAAVAQAALGTGDAAALRRAVHGNVVFIGASAGLGDRVQTPMGPRFGATVLAATTVALESGALFRPPTLLRNGVGWLVACLPAVIAWRRGKVRPSIDLRWVAASLLLLVSLDAAAVSSALLRSDIAAPAIALLLFGLGSMWNSRRAMLAENDRLEEERHAALAASRMKSEFLAHMSHEIRTPMNALLGAAELLAQTPLDERQRRHVTLFRSAGASLMEILDDLLDLSKIEAGLMQLDPRPFSLDELMAGQIHLFEARAEQKGLRLRTELEPTLPPVVHGDPKRLAQVLRNLLGNAVKFTREGGVTLAVRHAAEGATRLRFEVRDSGIGISPQRQEQIFLPFEQADSGIARVYGGTGLGLAISRRLVALMGGTIGVHSRAQEGATFWFEIDLPPSREPAQVGWASSQSRPPPGPAAPLRILLADDNPANVFLVQSFLEDDGHRIDVVGDGQAAVDRYLDHDYDLVLMDVQMPGMDGYAATRRLRAIERERGRSRVPVIALTANAAGDEGARSAEAGCTAYIAKPFSRSALRRAVAVHMAKPAPPSATAHGTAVLPPPLPALATDAGWDVADGLAHMDGSTELYLRVLGVAEPTLREWPARFAQALGEAERGNALRMAHDLKSIAQTLGASALAGHAQGIETSLRDAAEPGSPPPQADADTRFDEAVKGVGEELRRSAAALDAERIGR